MSIKQIIKKAFLISAISIVSLLAVSSVFLYFNKDSIIDRFIVEANKHLNVPVEVGSIDISVINTFPLIKIELTNVRIEGSLTSKENNPLIIAQRIDLLLDPWAIINGNFKVNGISFHDAQSHIYLTSGGESNYRIFKGNRSTGNEEFSFELSQIFLDNVNFNYTSELNDLSISISTPALESQMVFEGGTYYIKSVGNYLVEQINVKKKPYFTNKNIIGDISFSYNKTQKYTKIEESAITIDGSSFLVYGDYSALGDNPLLDLNLEGKETTIQTITGLLPDRFKEKVRPYKSNGSGYFNLALNGEISRDRGPSLEAEFGISNGQITYPSKQITLEEATAEGVLSIPNLFNLSTAQLKLSNLQGELEQKAFRSTLVYKNFNNPHMDLTFDGEFELNSLRKVILLDKFTRTEGLLDVSLQFKGALNDLKSRAYTNKILTNGEINFKNISIKHNQLKQEIKNLNGSLLFNNSDIALSDIKGSYGKSDFLLNGFFKNLLAHLLFENEPLGIEAKLNSNRLDLNEFLESSESSKEVNYTFKLSKDIRLKLDCDIGQLAFRRFDSKNISGVVTVKDEQIQAENLSFTGLGGKVEINGYANASVPNEIYTEAELQMEDVNIDSVFYVFENFNQEFIEYKHLKGKLSASVKSSLQLDSTLNLYPSSLLSEINMNIYGGELNDFEPIQQLSKYIDEDDLNAVKFSEISTDILIQDETVLIPEIQISSNATDFTVSGTHTFDQSINYKVATPLRRNSRIDKDEAFGAIEEIGGKTMLYLMITGTTSDYTVSYDKEEVKNKIAADLKKEVDELKRAFKNKGLKKGKKVELEEDDYFDW